MQKSGIEPSAYKARIEQSVVASPDKGHISMKLRESVRQKESVKNETPESMDQYHSRVPQSSLTILATDSSEQKYLAAIKEYTFTRVLIIVRIKWERGNLMDTGARGRGFDTYLRRVVPISKTLLLPQCTGNTQEAVAPSRHD